MNPYLETLQGWFNLPVCVSLHVSMSVCFYVCGEACSPKCRCLWGIEERVIFPEGVTGEHRCAGHQIRSSVREIHVIFFIEPSCQPYSRSLLLVTLVVLELFYFFIFPNIYVLNKNKFAWSFFLTIFETLNFYNYCILILKLLFCFAFAQFYNCKFKWIIMNITA